MYLTAKGIVIKKAETGENRARVTLFTSEHGILQFSCFGTHSLKSGSASALQLFTYGEFVLSERSGSYTLSSALRLESFESLSRDYEGLYLGSRLVSCAYELFHTGSYDLKNAFELLYTALSFTAYSELNPDDIYIFYLIKALDAAGICPCVTNCSVCGEELFKEKNILFSYRDGGATCSKCVSRIAEAKPVSKLSLEALRRMLLMDTSDIKKVVLPESVRKELLTILEEYKRYNE